MIRLPLLAFAFVVAASAPSAAQPAPRPVELADYYRVETAGGTAISPDGRSVAFVRTFIVEAENRRQSEILARRRPTAAAPPRRLTSPAFSASRRRAGVRTARCSPSRRGAPPSSRRRASRPIDLVPAHGSRPAARRSRSRASTGTPIFSPDNKWIAFTKAAPPADAAPTPRGRRSTRLTDERFTGRVYDWMNAPLRRPRLPARSARPARHAAAGALRRRPRRRHGEAAHDAGRRRDGAVVAARQPGAGVRRQQVPARRVRLRARRRLAPSTLDGTVDAADRRRLRSRVADVVARRRRSSFAREQGLSAIIAAKQPFGSPADVYRFPADGGALENLTAAWDLLPGAPRISPDGRIAVFHAPASAASTHLFRVPLDRRRGRAGHARRPPSRRLQSLCGAGDAMAYVAGDSAASGGGLRRRRSTAATRGSSAPFNDALLAIVELAAAERVRYPSKDGTADRRLGDAAARLRSGDAHVPLILAIHGGPHGAYGNDFSFQFQLWAAQRLSRCSTPTRAARPTTARSSCGARGAAGATSTTRT